MDFNEFEKNVAFMKQELKDLNIQPEAVKIEYTKLDGYNCLWAIQDSKVITYFKW